MLKGAAKPIRDLMLQRQTAADISWDDAQKAAVECEAIMYKQMAYNSISVTSAQTSEKPSIEVLATNNRFNSRQEK